MTKHRLFYLFVLLGVFVFYIIYPLWFAWYLLVVTLLFPVFDLLLSLPGMLSRSLSLSAAPVLTQGEAAALSLTTTSTLRAPAGLLKVRLRVHREGVTVTRRVRCDGARGSRLEVPVDTAHSGLLSFSVSRLWATSLMALFSIPSRCPCRVSVLILPAPVRPPNAARLPQSGPLRPKPGGGYAEEHDIRPYRPGDPLSNVHWKLSAKHDDLISREPLEQPKHSRLLLCSPWQNAGERDLILARLRWVSSYLLEHDRPHYVRLGEQAPVFEICREADFIACLRQTLEGAPPAVSAAPPPARFTWVFPIDAREDAS